MKLKVKHRIKTISLGNEINLEMSTKLVLPVIQNTFVDAVITEAKRSLMDR